MAEIRHLVQDENAKNYRGLTRHPHIVSESASEDGLAQQVFEKTSGKERRKE
jgi:hypothetical protein